MQLLGTIMNGSVLLDTPTGLPNGTRVMMLRSSEWFNTGDEGHIADLKKRVQESRSGKPGFTIAETMAMIDEEIALASKPSV